ncbi:MAG: hypothetical protein U0790_05930, partial [Isosphaeraceae bacterium]
TRPGPAGPSIPPGASAPPAKPRGHVVNAVKVRGRVDDELASLDVEIELALLVPGPLWVPLGLDVPIVSGAREGDRELELRRTPRGVWEARIQGSGPHQLHCEVKLTLGVSPDRTRLELAIPYALSTSLELDVPRQVFEVDLGTGEGIGRTPLAGGKGTRLSAHLSPRSRLALEWTDEEDNHAAAAPILAAKVEIALDADAEWITTLSSWEIRCLRGAARTLEIRLDDPDIVQMLKLDEQLLMTQVERNVLSIPLREALRAGGSVRLTLQTRRPVPAGSPGRFEFRGLPLANALEQSGAIGITPAANVWVNPTLTRGLRRIEPVELPRDLRARPGISLAFQFLDQPFQLGIEVEESPPLFRTETNSSIFLEGATARTESSITLHRVRGRLFGFDIALPPGLELVAVEPAELVETVIPAATASGPGKDEPVRPAGQVVKVHLGSAARDQKSLFLKVLGQQRIPEEGPVQLGLFAPLGGIPVGSGVTVYGGRGLSFEALPEPGMTDGPPAGGDLASPPIVDRARTTAGMFPLATLRSRENLTQVRGKLVRHPRSLTSETSVVAQVSGQGMEVSQDTTIRVRHDVLGSLTVQVPVRGSDAWQVLRGKDVVRREEIPGPGSEGSRYRLHFDPPVLDTTTLTFRFRRPLEPPLAPGTEARNAVRWVRLEGATPQRLAVTIATSPELRATVDDPAWAGEADEPERPEGGEPPRRYRPAGSTAPGLAELPFALRELDRVSLPPVVVPRVLLRSVLAPDHQVRTRAWYWVESHPSELSIRLPVGSRWVRARIDGRTAEQIETGPSGGGYRMLLPRELHSKPVLVELEYQSPPTAGGAVLDAPELSRGAVVLQSFWLVQIPWNEAVIGVPRGWNDENEWYWDAYVWKRRPWRPLSRLTSWVSGAPTTAPGPDDAAGEDPEDAHAYLFGRSGAPGSLPLFVAARAWLVALCSGLVLLAGLLVMYSRARFRTVWLAGAILGLAFVVFAHPSVVLLILQSAVFGVVLTLVGLAAQRLIERARHGIAPPGLPAAAANPSQSGRAASTPGPSGIGSDDSTAIRVRVTPSTMDHVAAPLVLSPRDAEPAGSSRVESPE